MENCPDDIQNLISIYSAFDPKIHNVADMLKVRSWKVLKDLLRREKFSARQLEQCVDICVDNRDWEAFAGLEMQTDITFNHFYLFRKAFYRRDFNTLKNLFGAYLARYNEDAEDLKLVEWDPEEQLIEFYEFILRHDITMPNWRSYLADIACKSDLNRLAERVYKPRDVSDNLFILKEIKPPKVLQFYKEVGILRFYRKKLLL